MAAAVAIVLPLYAQLLPGLPDAPREFGPARAIWPCLFVVWLVGGLSALIFPSHKRLSAALCVVVSLVAAIALPVASWGLSPPTSLLVALAIPSLIAPRTWPRQSHRAFALFVGVVTTAILVAALLQNPWKIPPWAHGSFLYLELGRFAGYMAVALIVGSLVLLAARKLALGSALALLSVPWLLVPVLTPALYISHTTVELSMAVGCVIAVGLLGLWCSVLWRRRELAS